MLQINKVVELFSSYLNKTAVLNFRHPFSVRTEITSQQFMNVFIVSSLVLPKTISEGSHLNMFLLFLRIP